MATLNPFQQYSQSENTVTNNVLLMLSSIYDISPKLYEEYINALINENLLVEVIPSFRQQVNNKGNGFMDGHITTKKTSIIIETKLSGLEAIDKLIKYSDSFTEEEISILIHLSQNTYDEATIELIRQKLLERAKKRNIKFYSLSYEDLVDQLKHLSEQHRYIFKLQRLFASFEEYCQNMNLLASYKHILRAMACGQSAELNVKHQFYFDMADRGFREFKYFGIYQKKSVSHIGLVENIIEADWSKKGGLSVKQSNKPVTQDQKKQLSIAIEDSINAGWRIDSNHRFFLFKDLTPTDYRKSSPGGIFRVRYFDLDEVLQKKVPEKITELADKLRRMTWR